MCIHRNKCLTRFDQGLHHAELHKFRFFKILWLYNKLSHVVNVRSKIELYFLGANQSLFYIYQRWEISSVRFDMQIDISNIQDRFVPNRTIYYTNIVPKFSSNYSYFDELQLLNCCVRKLSLLSTTEIKNLYYIKELSVQKSGKCRKFAEIRQFLENE